LERGTAIHSLSCIQRTFACKLYYQHLRHDSRAEAAPSESKARSEPPTSKMRSLITQEKSGSLPEGAKNEQFVNHDRSPACRHWFPATRPGLKLYLAIASVQVSSWIVDGRPLRPTIQIVQIVELAGIVATDGKMGQRVGIRLLRYRERHEQVFIRNETRTVVVSRPSSPPNSFSEAFQAICGRLRRPASRRTTCDVPRSV
jgi:hypothetical protein